MGPKTLTAVDEQFRLGADGHKKDGRCEDEPVCVEHFFCNYVIIVLDSAFSRFIAGVALCAGCNIELGKSEVFGLRTGGLGAGQGLSQEQVAVTFESGACGNTEDFHLISWLTD